jgi:hypothetical protein
MGRSCLNQIEYEARRPEEYRERNEAMDVVVAGASSSILRVSCSIDHDVTATGDEERVFTAFFQQPGDEQVLRPPSPHPVRSVTHSSQH